MKNNMIIEQVHKIFEQKLKFDEGVVELRKVLWDIGDEIGVSGDEVFKIYMDWMSSKK